MVRDLIYGYLLEPSCDARVDKSLLILSLLKDLKKNPPTDSPAIILPVFFFFFYWFLGKKESLQRGDAYSKTLKRKARGPSFASKTRTLFQKC